MERIAHLVDHDQEKIVPFLDKEDQPSSFEDFGDFQVLVLRRLQLADNQLELWSEVFLFLPESIFFYNREERAFEEISGLKELHKMIKKFYENNQRIIVGYSDEVEYLEDILFERDVPRHFMDTWFRLKKDMTRFENFYYRNLLVFHEFHEFISPRSTEADISFERIYASIKFQDSSVTAIKGRLDSLYNYYESIKDDHLNKSIFALTIISAVFLPLNLIVGFFGMNTEGLFFKDNPGGTINVVLLLAGITLVILVGFKVVRVLDQYLLRYILGRFNFYKRMTSRFDDLEKRFTVK